MPPDYREPPEWRLRSEYKIAKSKLQHGGLLAAVLAVIGCAMIVLADPSVPYAKLTGAINLALAAGIAFFVMRNAQNPHPLLVLDQDGIWYRDWGLDPVAWDRIAGVALGGSRMQSFACLELTDAEALFAGLSSERRRKVEANRLVRPPRLLIPNGALDAPLPDIVAAIRSGLEGRP